MKMKVNSVESKRDKFDREYIALSFVNTMTGKTWNFWLWSWLKDYHTAAVYTTGQSLQPGDLVDVLWKRAVYRGSDLQVITSLTFENSAEFVWRD